MLHKLTRFVRVLVLVQINDRDLGAFARHRNRDRASDATVAAGDDRDLAFQFADAGIFRAVIGPGRHLPLAAGLMLLFLGWHGLG